MSGDLTPELISASRWTDEQVAASGMPVSDAALVTIGGGLGSFALTDTLRIAGAPRSALRVLTTIDIPYQTYRLLAQNSQIPLHERIRSDAGSTIDNIWGFPSYAVREAWSAKGLSAKLDPLINVLLEPVGADYWTPKAEQVYRSVDREAARIGWSSMLVKGAVRMIRARHGGGYFSVLTPPPPPGPSPDTPARMVVRSTYVHLAVGYPGLRFLDDLQAYRQAHGDFSRVVNAYEAHDHVYEELLRRPSTVVVRGSGIVGMRILVRLLEDRERRGANTTIFHLFRNYVSGPQGDNPNFRRPGRNGFAYQGFNYPKAAWGGQLKESLEKLEGPERARYIGLLGGTNVPHRRAWEALLERGRQGGWYQQWVGQVSSVAPGPNQTIVTTITDPAGRSIPLAANFIIDATGLESDISEHRLLADLLEHSAAGRNPSGRLDVEPTFEIRGTRNEPGRMYASGSSTLGGYYAGVDSFLGLQYAAVRIVDDLAAQGFGTRIGTSQSVREWLRWMRNRPVPG
ncbi:MAG: hypothetical protein ACK5RL_00765 [Acidimicrobiales bacterium]